jgi:uncharacterized protein
MSSTERAPEPTMEEILASIRRIISDEEGAGETQPKPVAASAAPAEEEVQRLGQEDEADKAIIDDIARVLSGETSGAEEEDDILDLTSEFDAAPAQEAAETGEEILDLSETAVETEEVVAESVDDEAAEIAFANLVGAVAEDEGEEAGGASIFEQAFPSSGEQNESAEVTEPSWTAPDEPEARPVNGSGAHKEPEYEADDMSSPLDDDVKEMLRPLVRQWLDKNMRSWLDENMSRLLVAALRDELKASSRDRRN